MVEMSFQAMSNDATSLLCSVGGHEVCRFNAQTGHYDGTQCWFVLPPGDSFDCTLEGSFFLLGTNAAALAQSIAPPVTTWQSKIVR